MALRSIGIVGLLVLAVGTLLWELLGGCGSRIVGSLLMPIWRLVRGVLAVLELSRGTVAALLLMVLRGAVLLLTILLLTIALVAIALLRGVLLAAILRGVGRRVAALAVTALVGVSAAAVVGHDENGEGRMWRGRRFANVVFLE